MNNNKPDFKTICRLCTKSSLSLSSLYDNDQDGISCEEKLKIICGIEISSEDVLPKTICQYCRRKLRNCFEFRNMCLTSIHTLAKYLNLEENTEDYLKIDDNVDDSDIRYYLEVDEDYLAECSQTINFEDTNYYTTCNIKDFTEEYLEDKVEEEKQVEVKLTNQNVETNENIKVKRKYKYKMYNDPSKRHKCQVCKKRFNTELKVKLHMRRIHNEIYLKNCNVTCEKCGMKFQHLRNLKRHLVYHNIGYSYFGCNFCDTKLYSKKSWRKHIKIHDETINEICKICNKIIHSSVAKVYHMDYHKTKESIVNKTFYNCFTCHVDFNQFEDLEEHVAKIHAEINLEKHQQQFDEVEKNFERIFNDTPTLDNELNKSKFRNIFKCNLCSLYYENLNELKNHVTECFLKVNAPKSFMCDTCGKCFKSSWLLTNHKAGHSSMRKFICDICGQAFKWHNDLTNHVNRIHEKLRPYICKYCGKTCTTSATLKVHLRSHSKERPYCCQICNTSFAQNSSLKEHMFKHTGGQEGTCSICNKTFKTPLRLRTHMKRHNTQRQLYSCDLCGRMFTEKSSVRKHMYKIHSQ